MEILTAGAELFHADGRKDKQTERQTNMTMLIVIICHPVNVARNNELYQVFQTLKSISIDISVFFSLDTFSHQPEMCSVGEGGG
jgi:hypothetical protein